MVTKMLRLEVANGPAVSFALKKLGGGLHRRSVLLLVGGHGEGGSIRVRVTIQISRGGDAMGF